MALSDANASPEQLAQLAASQQRRKLVRADAQAFEQAHTSEPREFADEGGSVWTYTVFDATFVKILGCRPAGPALRVPDAIGGVPVLELGVDCCAELPGVEEVVCPEHVTEVGLSAFRRNGDLRRLVLPRDLDVYSPTWVRGCGNLEELVLPGLVRRLDSSIFDSEKLKKLRIGHGTREVIPGAFSKSKLESVEVDPENPYLTCDGNALIADGGAVLLVLAVPCGSYRLPPSCTRIERKAFSGRAELASVELPAGLREIGPYAFARTGLARFEAPPALESIGERAFYRSQMLADVQLNEGLTAIGDYAFAGTALTRLQAPASIETLGVSPMDKDAMFFGDDEAGFTIAPGARTLVLDEHGGLYRHTEGGTHFVRMLDPDIRSYRVAPGTRVVDTRAFARHRGLCSLVLPEGVEVVEEAAFKDCERLVRASLPSTLRAVGEEAFLDTVLEELHLPAALEKLGDMALVTRGAHHDQGAPSLRTVTVEDGNARFFVDQGMLCEHVDDGGLRVVLFTDSEPCVRIPANTASIAPYAFNGARRLRELYLSDSIGSVGTNALALDSPLELLHVDLARPVEGHGSFDLRFPQTERSAHEISLAFSTTSWIDIERILKHYDNTVINMHGYDARTSGSFDLYGQASRMLERLLDPVLMTSVNRNMYDAIIARDLVDICVAAARNDDRGIIDALVELGYLDGGNLLEVIDAVMALQDAAMTGYLLELKRRMLRSSAVDFEL